MSLKELLYKLWNTPIDLSIEPILWGAGLYILFVVLGVIGVWRHIKKIVLW